MKGDPWWLGFPFESKHRGGFREDPSWFFWVVAALTRALLQDDFPGQALGVRWNLQMSMLIGLDEGAVGLDFGYLHLLTPFRATYDPFGHAFGRWLKLHLDPQRAGGMGVDPDVISDPWIPMGV